MKTFYYLFLKGKFYSFSLLFCFCVCFISAKTQLQFNPIIQNLDKPVAIANAADSSGRLFLVEQTGKIKIYKNGSLSSKPFIDLTNLVAVGQFRGLWSIAFPPNYKKNRFFFLYYDDKNGNTVVARYKTSKTNPDSAIVNSGVILLSDSTGYHLGEMHFGKDGYLYITMNDGSYMLNNTRWAQDSTVFLDKMLRLNVNTVNPPYYSIPPSNPYISDPNVLPQIFLFGFRNAWRWSFDRVTGNIWLADVGGDQEEEVDLISPSQQAGADYGWPCYEGNIPFLTNGCSAKQKYVFPIFTYLHDTAIGGECIIGGYVYRGSAYPSLKKKYICSDYVSNNAWIITRTNTGNQTVQLQMGIPAQIECYGEDEAGELYAASLNGIIYSVASQSIVANQSQNQLNASAQSVQLNTSARLYQNIPNPFSGSTTIGYFLPIANSSAYINFYASSGLLLKSVKLYVKGNGTINIKASELPIGIYQYALVIDGKVIDTKQMEQKK